VKTEEEILATFDDLRAIGGYCARWPILASDKKHLPVQRWVTRKSSNRVFRISLAKGFRKLPSGPLVRSSYRADRVLRRTSGLAEPAAIPGHVPDDKLDSLPLSVSLIADSSSVKR